MKWCAGQYSAAVVHTNADEDCHPASASRNEQLAVSQGWFSQIKHTEMVMRNGRRMLEVSLDSPLPKGYFIDSFTNNNWLCLRNHPLGGMWKVHHVSSDSHKVHCEVSRGENPSSEAAEMPSGEGFDWEVVQHQDRTIVVAKEDLSKEPLAKSYPADLCVDSVHGFCFLLQPMVVYCRANILSIGSIDTVDQSFFASYFCEVRLRGISVRSDVHYTQEFLALLDVADKLCPLRIKEEQSIERYTAYLASHCDGYQDYCWKLFIKGVFHEEFELEAFPLDVQELSLVVTCNVPHILRFVPNLEYPSVFVLQDFQLRSVYDMAYREVVLSRCSHSDPSESASGYLYPRCLFVTKVMRKSGFYASNVAVPIGVLSALSIISMSINEDGSRLDTASRLGITLTLLLTAVAYKFVVASSLPTLSYQTLLDRYVWCCFAFMIVLGVENAVVPILLHRVRWSSEHRKESLEPYLALALGALYLFMNVWWVGSVWQLVRRNRRTAEREYAEEKARRKAHQPQRKR